MSCPSWCSCSCHVPELSGLISLWIYGAIFALFLGVVFIRFMRAKADYWYLEKALLTIDHDDEMYDDAIRGAKEQGEPEREADWRQKKADRVKLREQRQGKAPLWLRGFYTPRASRD